MSKQKSINTRKLLSILVMSVCLFLLTGINFYIYPQHNTIITHSLNTSGELCGEEAPSVPAEEKSSQNNITIHEDFLHENDSDYWLLTQSQLLHQLMSADKLQVIHYELISPPPDC